MIILSYKSDLEDEDISVNKITMEVTENGHIDSYIEAFGNFLRAVGFYNKTIREALPSFEV